MFTLFEPVEVSTALYSVQMTTRAFQSDPLLQKMHLLNSTRTINPFILVLHVSLLAYSPLTSPYSIFTNIIQCIHFFNTVFCPWIFHQLNIISLYSFCILAATPPFFPLSVPTFLIPLKAVRITSDLGLQAQCLPTLVRHWSSHVSALRTLACILMRARNNELTCF